MGIFEHSHDATGKVIRKGVEGLATATPVSAAGAEIMKKLNKFKNMAAGFLNFYTFAILILLIVLILRFYLSQLDKEKGNVELMKEELEYFNPKILPISSQEYSKNIPIRDYYVMSSYNSCAGGETWQDWVSIDILREIINNGVRCVDLEIYYKNNKCVVAVGPEAQNGNFVLKNTPIFSKFIKDFIKSNGKKVDLLTELFSVDGKNRYFIKKSLQKDNIESSSRMIGEELKLQSKGSYKN